MTRSRYARLAGGLLLIVIVTYVARNTYWAEITLPLPPQGEARTNPFYASQRFVEALGGRTAWDRSFTVPPPGAVVVISSWHWSLSSRRRETIERWVESGGRLVVDALLLYPVDEFERWSGIEWTYPEFDFDEVLGETDDQDEEEIPDCRTMAEELGGGKAGSRYWLCVYDESWLTPRMPVEWGLRDEGQYQAVRVAVGKGSVTVINANPFRDRQIFDADHGAVLVAAAELRRGDEVRFLSEDDHPSIIALAWHHGASVVILALTLAGIGVWRNASRFGPLMAPPDTARRSLAEQIRGSGRFALRHGSGDALHAAVVRAVHEAAGRKVAGYPRLPPEEQLTALARATGFDRSALAEAIHHAGMRRAQALRSTLALLEAARRALAADETGRSHGTD